TPYEFICKIWTSEPERFTMDPRNQMPGLNTSRCAVRTKSPQGLPRRIAPSKNISTRGNAP
ncbi:MAG: hypothetical protein AAF479_06910, partial [Pseudomonadota bacterium]